MFNFYKQVRIFSSTKLICYNVTSHDGYFDCKNYTIQFRFFISFGPVPHSLLPLSLSELAVSMATVTRHEDIEDTAGDVLRLITSLP